MADVVMQTVRMRYFAAVAEAAGVREESVSIASGSTAEQLRALLVDVHGPEFARVLGVSALLAEGKRLDGAVVVPQTEGIQVDVLPPFAGG
ncbi:MAG: MoaD/ThiS family protein [Ancrocorticia sp.]